MEGRLGDGEMEAWGIGGVDKECVRLSNAARPERVYSVDQGQGV